MNYKQKYLKYKTKYLNQLKRGGAVSTYNLNEQNDVTTSNNYKELKQNLENMSVWSIDNLKTYFNVIQANKSDIVKIRADKYYYGNPQNGTFKKVEGNAELEAFQKDILSFIDVFDPFNQTKNRIPEKELIDRLSPLFTIKGVNQVKELFYPDLSQSAFDELDRKNRELKAREAELNRQEKERANSNTVSNSVITEVPLKIVPSYITTCNQYKTNCNNPALKKGTFKDFCNSKLNCDTEDNAKKRIALKKL